MSGCKIDSPKRQALLKMTLNGFGVRNNNKALEINASPDNFALRKHNLLQAMLAVNDLFYLASPLIAPLFFEDGCCLARSFRNSIHSKVKLTGKSGYDHLFDFIIPKSPKKPERILRTINRPNRETAQAMAFSWIDTKDVRPPESRAYALLNDSDHSVSESVLDAMRNYDVYPVLWSRRSETQQELAA